MLPLRDQLHTRRTPVVNLGLIGANVAAFLYEMSAISGADQLPGGLPEAAARHAEPDFISRWALIPAEVVAHPLAHAPTLVTHMFLHGGIGHIAGNMLFLYIFGDNVEDALGHFRYAAFYLLSGLCAAAAQIAMAPGSEVPMLGASGAIAGVLAAYGFLYPTSPITVVNPIPLLWLAWGFFIYLPAWIVIAEFFVVNLWSALQPSNPSGGVAFAAHVGGFIAGAILLPLMRPKPVEYDRWQRLAHRRGHRN